METVGTMRFFQNGRADTLRSEQTGQSRQGFGKLRRIAQRCFKKTKLLLRRLGRLRFERDRGDRRLRFKIFQMRVQHPKEHFDVVGRLRNFEAMLVTLFVAKSDSQLQLLRDEIERSEPQRDLLLKNGAA